VLDAQPLFAPGSSFSYADTNYILLGMVIERITGRTYYQELDDRILRPLSLGDTTPSDRPDLPGLVCGHTTPDNPFRVPVRTLRDGRYPMNPQVEWTGGGLISTSADLVRWALALYAGDVLAPAMQQHMLTTGVSDLGQDVRYGLGVMTWEGRHGQVRGHTGWVPGYVSGMAYFPRLRLALAVQFNSDVNRSGDAMRAFLDDVAGTLAPLLSQPPPPTA
jgi:D-alanyl-D-alanine carboxypeptidase